MSIFDDPIDPRPGWQLDHLRKYVKTGGRDGHLWMGVPSLLLTVRDAAAGRARRNPLFYGKDGDRYVVVASAGGRPKHPQWYRLLEVDPEVRVQVLDKIFPARAEPATDGERERLWRLMSEIWPDYDSYQAKTDRQIPVVVITPA